MEILIGAGIAAFVLLAVVWFACYERAQLLDRFDVEREGWADERRELLNRIQHPERMPVKQSTGRTGANMSPEARRALHDVGRVAPQTEVIDGD
jgi:hypothetical protein